MQIRYHKNVTCPCCETSFYLQFPESTICLPISDEQKAWLKKLEELNHEIGIETNYSFI